MTTTFITSVCELRDVDCDDTVLYGPIQFVDLFDIFTKRIDRSDGIYLQACFELMALILRDWADITMESYHFLLERNLDSIEQGIDPGQDIQSTDSKAAFKQLKAAFYKQFYRIIRPKDTTRSAAMYRDFYMSAKFEKPLCVKQKHMDKGKEQKTEMMNLIGCFDRFGLVMPHEAHGKMKHSFNTGWQRHTKFDDGVYEIYMDRLALFGTNMYTRGLDPHNREDVCLMMAYETKIPNSFWRYDDRPLKTLYPIEVDDVVQPPCDDDSDVIPVDIHDWDAVSRDCDNMPAESYDFSDACECKIDTTLLNGREVDRARLEQKGRILMPKMVITAGSMENICNTGASGRVVNQRIVYDDPTFGAARRILQSVSSTPTVDAGARAKTVPYIRVCMKGRTNEQKNNTTGTIRFIRTNAEKALAKMNDRVREIDDADFLQSTAVIYRMLETLSRIELTD